jgi:DNA-binding HxlR family transcriptional regulator
MTDNSSNMPNTWLAAYNTFLDTAPEQLRPSLQNVVDDVVSKQLNGENQSEGFVWHTADEALQPLAPIGWIVEPIFSAGSVNIVFGAAKSKKTYVMMDCLVAIARGASQWLNYKVKQCPVLIVDEESGERRMKRRLRDVQYGHDVARNLPLEFMTMEGFNPIDAGHQTALRAKITQTGAQVVLIDALVDVLIDADENNATEVQRVFHALRQVAEDTGVCVIVIHHANRGGEYRGSSAMRGAVDLLLKIESKPAETAVQFKLEAPRDTEPFEFTATANFGEGTFCLSSSHGTAKSAEQTIPRGEMRILRYLQSHDGEASLQDIREHEEKLAKKTVQNTACSLAKKGYTERVDGGGRGQSVVYALTEKGWDQVSPVSQPSPTGYSG